MHFLTSKVALFILQAQRLKKPQPMPAAPCALVLAQERVCVRIGMLWRIGGCGYSTFTAYVDIIYIYTYINAYHYKTIGTRSFGCSDVAKDIVMGASCIGTC